METRFKNIFTSKQKDRWLSVCLSYIVPGLGQFYAGRPRSGIFFFIIYVLLNCGFFAFFAVLSRMEKYQLMPLSLIIPGVAGIWGIISFCTAYFSANPSNEYVQYAPKTKKPFLAVFLSLILPGLGQIYNGQLGKTLLVWIGSVIIMGIVGVILSSHNILVNLITSVISIAITLFFVFDAVKTAIKKSGQPFYQENEKKIIGQTMRGYILIYLVVISVAVVLALGIKANIVGAYKIPTGSMQPTLRGADDYKIGDHVLVNKLVKDRIQRGDLVVFRYPKDPSKDFIKRCIGLPGETVRIINKKVFINEKPLEEPWLKKYPPAQYFIDGDNVQPYPSPRDNFGPVKIPDDTYFMLGDNRDNSSDSRFWGVVTGKEIRGKAFFIYWPLKRIGLIGNF